ncbi:glycosyltransferase [Candidatus Saccharibacteria bacterium]|nr:glycosyltransferase [Candidatus Saccharibacteria bacterium]
MASKPPQISVVIPAYNEATYIDRLLEALAKQSFKDLEVIVSDAESKDGTAEVIASFQDKLDINFVESPPKGPAHGRNAGAKLAKGEWLLFLDADDDIDDPDFVGKLLEGAKTRSWQTATAKIKVKDSSFFEKFGTAANYRYIKLLSHTRHPVAPGYCILTKRRLFEKLNGFNEKIQFGEDYDYVSRSAKSGFGFVEDAYYYIDLRRYRQEGISFALKGIANEIYRHTHGYNLEKNPIKYQFGKHKKRQW